MYWLCSASFLLLNIEKCQYQPEPAVFFGADLAIRRKETPLLKIMQ